MANALIGGWMYDDMIITVNPRLTASIITKGDYVVASGSAVIGGESGLLGDQLRASGLGIALGQNPSYNELGVAVVNTGLAIATRGVIRVTAAHSAVSAGMYPVGQPVFPATTASGIVGQTGRTGLGAQWETAAVVSPPTAASAGSGWSRAMFSGVAKIINVVSVGNSGVGQWDIQLFPQGAHGYI